MKIRIVLISGAIMAAPLLTIGVVSAEDSMNMTTGGSSSTTTNGGGSTAKPATAAEKAAQMKARIEERKQKLKTTLTALEKTRIQTKCKNSQGKLTSLDAKIKGIETSRGKVYDGLFTRLNTLDERLMSQGADTTALMGELEALKAKIDTYKADLVLYQQAVADTSQLDCASDPVAFKASLETSRAALEKLRADATDIRTYVNKTIKPTLQTLRTTLEKKTGTTTGGAQ